MDSVLRGLAVYLFLLAVFWIAGRRTLSEMTNFDLILLLIISETTQQAMIDNDHSMTNGFLLIATLVGTTIFISLIKNRFPLLEKWLDHIPVIVVDHGKMLKDRMTKIRISEEDILAEARKFHGLERLDQIKYAIAESNGEITIVPAEKA